MFTVLLPATAPLGTVAVIEVADHEVTAVVVVPKFTEPVVEPKFVPVSVKEEPAGPKAGEMLVICVCGPLGTIFTQKLLTCSPGPPTQISVPNSTAVKYHEDCISPTFRASVKKSSRFRASVRPPVGVGPSELFRTKLMTWLPVPLQLQLLLLVPV
jgi:hypothetical protein